MTYFKIDTGKFIEFNEDTNSARILVKADLITEKKALIDRIKVNPQPTNTELLEWAKENYPYVDHSVEEKELENINLTLDAIRAL